MLTVMYREYRENLPVEIALLASLMLHVFAFGTWQYRGVLAKLPLLSALSRIMSVVHLPQSPATPQVTTMTFVAVDDPRTKAQREHDKQAQQLIETDASQVTGEKPKDAKYYSDKSTLAANPHNPTHKEGDTPYLEGKETRVMSTLDVPTQSGVASPPVVQPGSPGAPGRPTPPSIAKKPPQPQPALQDQPKEIPPLGVKIVEEEKMAMAPNTAVQPEVATSSDAPVSPAMVGDGGTPAAASDPGTPGREIIARKAHLTAVGVTRTGIAAFNVEESPFGAYDKKIFKAVQSRWYALIDRFGMYERAGAVTVHFELLDDGQIRNLKVSDNTAGQILSLFCEKAIIESGPFEPLPDNLRALVGKEPREASFTFYY
ncbi:MAG TPA: hypothetical protein VLZ30_00720 [Verrucomicrobiae bacterium]|nr:hypothetical protein [Verrucomicrobiae bacterium]